MTALGDPQTCPHGHPIPPKDLTEPVRSGIPLAQVEPGKRVIVSGVTEQMPEILRYLGQVGLRPGAKLRVIEKAPLGGPMTIEVAGAAPCDLAGARAHGHDRVITRFLIVLNVIGFCGSLRRGARDGCRLAAVTAMDRVLSCGALIPARVLQDGQWWRIVTGAFLHGGLIHIARQHAVALVPRALHRVCARVVADAARLYGFAGRVGIRSRLFQRSAMSDGRRERSNLRALRRALCDRF